MAGGGFVEDVCAADENKARGNSQPNRIGVDRILITTLPSPDICGLPSRSCAGCKITQRQDKLVGLGGIWVRIVSEATLSCLLSPFLPAAYLDSHTGGP